jgi:hypothetical protein
MADVINWKAGKYSIQEIEEIYFDEFYRPVDYKLKADNKDVVQQTFKTHRQKDI